MTSRKVPSTRLHGPYAPCRGQLFVIFSRSLLNISLTGVLSQAREELVRDEVAVREFKKEDRVQVKVDPVCLFLTREGKVGSFSLGIACRLGFIL
jgi:hypothetical protein